MEYIYDYILFLRFSVYIFFYLVKRSVVTIVGKTQCYRNDCCYYYLTDPSGQWSISLPAGVAQNWTVGLLRDSGRGQSCDKLE